MGWRLNGLPEAKSFLRQAENGANLYPKLEIEWIGGHPPTLYIYSSEEISAEPIETIDLAPLTFIEIHQTLRSRGILPNSDVEFERPIFPGSRPNSHSASIETATVTTSTEPLKKLDEESAAQLERDRLQNIVPSEQIHVAGVRPMPSHDDL